MSFSACFISTNQRNSESKEVGRDDMGKRKRVTLFCSVVVYEICFVDEFDAPDTTINDSSAGKMAKRTQN
jgi:hypothetical protein